MGELNFAEEMRGRGLVSIFGNLEKRGAAYIYIYIICENGFMLSGIRKLQSLFKTNEIPRIRKEII